MTQEQNLPSTPAPSAFSRFVNGVKGIADGIVGRASKTASNILGRGNDFPKEEYFRITNRLETGEPQTLKRLDQNLTEGEGAQHDAITLPARIKKRRGDAEGGVIIADGERLNKHGGKSLINKYLEQGTISFAELGIEIDTNYVLTNRTAKRIGIKHFKYKERLVIPPFGIRVMNSESLKGYFFESWKSQNLISIEKEATGTSQAALFTFGLLVILLGIFLLGSLLLEILSPNTLDAKTFGTIGAVLLALLFINFIVVTGGQTGNVKQWSSILWDWLKLSPGLVIVALTGFGLPLWITFSWGGGREILAGFQAGDFSLLALGRLIQNSFICVAAIMPALFYYLFGRQQVATLREKFFRDVMILDPHTYTLSEAETKYGSLLNSAYGSSSANSPFNILLLVFSTTILVMGWVMTITPYSLPNQSFNTLIDFFDIKATPFTLGFLGAYFFSINMVFRRYVRADLTPKTYAYITVRLLITLVLVWAVATLQQFNTIPLVESGILAVAFIIGIFPDTGLTLLKEAVRKTTGTRFVNDSLPLTDIDGMNLYDQARLLEEGIENIENLAHHNFVELLAFTRISTPRLVDMFDQAILYLHINDTSAPSQSEEQTTENESGKERNKYLSLLRTYGIRTATDLLAAMEGLDQQRDGIQSAPADLQIERLRLIRETLKDDEWLGYIQTWRKETVTPSVADNPYMFYEGSMDEVEAEEDSSKVRKESKSPTIPPAEIIPVVEPSGAG